ncbi:hypothetical protein LTR85_012082 [Meristemomyces frigidus]|nr:hypothetical protein LTR85_012082 [Meristemomyces frigidus]
MQMSTSSFQYSPLLPGGETFRLLLLRPWSEEESLQCSIEQFTLDEAPRYEALSYVWGDPHGLTPLRCGERGELQIRANLREALTALRHPQESRRLWVDALCINQADDDERAQQVLMMRKIYASATGVVVWLGTRTQDVENALELASNLRRFSHLVDPVPSDHRASFWELSVPRAIARAEESGEVRRSLFAISELADLFDRPWFVRIWCVQEVVASNNAMAMCGNLEVPFADVIAAAPFVLKFRSRWFTGKPLEFWNTIALQKYGNTPFSSIEGSVGTLEKILVSTRDFEATDPRDKIFAVMGIVDEGRSAVGALFPAGTVTEAQGVTALRNIFGRVVGALAPLGRRYTPKLLKVDYRKDVMEVYRDASRFMLRKPPRLSDVLCQVQHVRPPGGDSAWPSWVPDWSKPRNTSVFGGMGIFCADAEWIIQHDNGFSPQMPNRLFLDGFVDDRIVRVTDVFIVDVSEDLELEAAWSQLFDWPMIGGVSLRHNEGESLALAFFMTLLVGELGQILYDGQVKPEVAQNMSTPELRAILLQDAPRLQQDAAAFQLLRCHGSASQYPVEMSSLRRAAEEGVAEHYEQAAKANSFGRRLYLTEAGTLGLGPRVTQPGDEVVVLFGGRMPFVLRPHNGHYLFIGDSYLRWANVMWGEASERVRGGMACPFRQQTFEIR